MRKEMSDNETPDNVAELEKPLQEMVLPEGPLKQNVVDYVGSKIQPENGQVTLEMIIDVFMEEFPEFVLALAEENFLRGYKQCLSDIEQHEKSDGTEVAEFVDVASDEQS